MTPVNNAFARYESPESLLTYTLDEMGVTAFARDVYRDLPDMQEVTKRFVWRYSDLIRLPLIANRGPRFVDACVANALVWIDAAPDEMLLTRRESQTIYMAGLLYQVPELLNIQIEVDGASWGVSDPEHLGDMVKEGRAITFKRSPTADQSAEAGNARTRMAALMMMYPEGTHLELDVDTQALIWPPASMVALGDSDDRGELV